MKYKKTRVKQSRDKAAKQSPRAERKSLKAQAQNEHPNSPMAWVAGKLCFVTYVTRQYVGAVIAPVPGVRSFEGQRPRPQPEKTEYRPWQNRPLASRSSRAYDYAMW